MAIWAILFGTLIVFTGAMTYLIMAKPMQGIHDHVEPGIDAEHIETFNKIKSSWDRWPIVLFFMVILMMIVWVVKSRGPGETYRYG